MTKIHTTKVTTTSDSTQEPTENTQGPVAEEPQPYSGGRLQRPAVVGAFYVESFEAVWRRHGQTMAGITVACLLLCAGMNVAVVPIKLSSLSLPVYGAMLLGLVLFYGLVCHLRGIDLSRVQWRWLSYLLFISAVEELAFRVLMPSLVMTLLPFTAAIIVSNVVFAGLHYFTLRWRWTHCAFVFLGGLGLARLLNGSNDLMLVVVVHAIFTFLNTPQPPRSDSMAGTSKGDTAQRD